MTEKPQSLSETPPADPLSDLLGSMHLSGTVLFRGEFREPWSVSAPSSCHLGAMLPFRTEHIIPFHVVATGSCDLELPNETVRLYEGDAVLLPYGDSHRLSGGASATSVEVVRLLPQPPWQHIPVIEHGGDGPCTRVICGFLQCDELLFDPLLRQLPALLHVSSRAVAGDDWLATTIRHTAAAASRPEPGSRSMLPRLTELMFVEILRKHIHSLSEEQVGWFAAFNDPVVGSALRCLHASPHAPWTIDTLARRAGVSRTVLGERFKRFLDRPPMHYLAQWRLLLAAQRLKTSDAPVKTIADESAYESEAAFSRAFKRRFGVAPADWRKRSR